VIGMRIDPIGVFLDSRTHPSSDFTDCLGTGSIEVTAHVPHRNALEPPDVVLGGPALENSFGRSDAAKLVPNRSERLVSQGYVAREPIRAVHMHKLIGDKAQQIDPVS